MNTSRHVEQIGTGLNLPRRRGKSRASLDLIEAAYGFLATAHPTSVRGVCYHLFTKGVISSMAKNETSRVSRQLTDAREGGIIPWGWIVDETRELEREPSWNDPDDFVATVRRAYRRDFWTLQPRRVEVWSEKGTVRGILDPVLRECGVGFRVMHGFGSATSVYDAARSGGRESLSVLYVGDYDPSGLYMSELDLPRRIERYSTENTDIAIRRIALTTGHTIGLPSFPASDKKNDPRHNWFAETYGDRCWELDAMDPNALRGCVESEIVGLIEPTAWERCVVAQESEQASLQSVLDNWCVSQ